MGCFPRPKAPGTDFPHPHSSFFCSALVMPLVHSAHSGHKSEIPSPHFSPILSPPQSLLFAPPLVLLETSTSSFTLDQEQYSILFLYTHRRLSHLLMLKALPSHQSGDPFCQKLAFVHTACVRWRRRRRNFQGGSSLFVAISILSFVGPRIRIILQIHFPKDPAKANQIKNK